MPNNYIFLYRDSSVDNFEDNLQYVECPVEDLVTIGALKFDCVVASEVIEHIPDPKSFLKNCCDLIKVGKFDFYATIILFFSDFLYRYYSINVLIIIVNEIISFCE